MAVTDITDVVFSTYYGAAPMTLPAKFAPTISGDQVQPFSVRVKADFTGGPVRAAYKITDPLGIEYEGNSSANANSLEQGVAIRYVGTHLLELTLSDSSGTKTFPFEVTTTTQYDSGGGQMRDIPLTITGEAQPPWEWLPRAGYYNPGDGIMKPGNNPVALNSNFHCDLITRQCRPKYLGTPMACEIYPPDSGYNNSQIMKRITPPLREIPPALLEHKRSRDQSTCWCWAIKPRGGEWEAYTSLNRDIALPAYTDSKGNTVPAMTYLSAGGIVPTAIPTRLSLAKSAMDVTVLAFDREKLQAQYYTGAEYEVFEINYRGDLSERWVGSSGKLGNTTLSDSSATIELTPWSDVANRPIGRELTVLCDVGSRVDEEFGTGRCRNQALNDGPDKDDWTLLRSYRGGSKTEVLVIYGWSNQLQDPSVTTKSGQPVPEDWHRRLRAGKVLFTSGKNKGVERDIQTASRVAADGPGASRWADVSVHFHVPLPFTPAVGDTFEVTAGCRRTLQDCAFYDNIKNFRGFPDVPGREGALRRYRDS